MRDTFLGRYGEKESRCRGPDGSFTSCGLGDPGRRMGFMDAPRRAGFMDAPRYGRGMGMNLPVIGTVNVPKTISFDVLPGAIGIGLGKIGPGVLGGILGLFITGGETYTKVIVGGLAGLTLFSERLRRNSYLVGFALATLPDMVEPLIQSVLDTVMPAKDPAANRGMRRIGQVSAQEAAALRRAHAQLLSSADGGGFVGRNIPLASDIMRTTQRVPLAGLNDNGFRNIA